MVSGVSESLQRQTAFSLITAKKESPDSPLGGHRDLLQLSSSGGSFQETSLDHSTSDLWIANAHSYPDISSRVRERRGSVSIPRQVYV